MAFRHIPNLHTRIWLVGKLMHRYIYHNSYCTIDFFTVSEATSLTYSSTNFDNVYLQDTCHSKYKPKIACITWTTAQNKLESKMGKLRSAWKSVSAENPEQYCAYHHHYHQQCYYYSQDRLPCRSWFSFSILINSSVSSIAFLHKARNSSEDLLPPSVLSVPSSADSE